MGETRENRQESVGVWGGWQDVPTAGDAGGVDDVGFVGDVAAPRRCCRGDGTSGGLDQAFHGQPDEQGGEHAEQRAVQDILGVGLVRLAFVEPQDRLGGKQKPEGVEVSEEDEDEDQGSFDVADLASHGRGCPRTAFQGRFGKQQGDGFSAAPGQRDQRAEDDECSLH